MPLQIFLFCILLLSGLVSQAQDTLIVKKNLTLPLDTLSEEHKQDLQIQKYKERYDPRKASLYAAILPGMGQIYNKKYWKLPLVYGGIYATLYGFNFYQNLYTDYKSQLFEVLRTGENSKNPGIGESVLRPAIDKARRERDFMVIILAGVYILQIIDAHVDAHLKEFDFNPNLHVRFKPAYEDSPAIGRVAGISLNLRF